MFRRYICGVDRLCSGFEIWFEGAIHLVQELFNEKGGTGWALLLVDAWNMFHMLNRVVALRNT